MQEKATGYTCGSRTKKDRRPRHGGMSFTEGEVDRRLGEKRSVFCGWTSGVLIRQPGIIGGINAAISVAAKMGAVTAAGRRVAGRQCLFFCCRVSAEELANRNRAAVNVESPKCHCSTGVMVAGGEHRGVFMIGAVLDSGRSVSTIGLRRLQQHFPEYRVAYPYGGMQRVQVADGRPSRSKHVIGRRPS